jgi:predicted transcriptional regulator
MTEENVGKVESLFDGLVALVEENRVDMQKFDKGQNAPGPRLRKVLQAVKTNSQDLRIAIMDEIKARKTK